MRNRVRANMQDRREKVTQALTTGFTEGAVTGFKKGSKEGAQQGAAEGFKKGASEGFKDGASDGFKQGAREGFQENGVKGAINGGAQGALKGAAQGALQTGTQEAIKGGVHGAIKGGTQEAIKGGVHGAINSGVNSMFDTSPTARSKSHNNNLSLFSEPKHDASNSHLVEKASVGFITGGVEGAKEGYRDGFKTGFQENGLEGAREKGRQSAIRGGIHGGINGAIDALNDDNKSSKKATPTSKNVTYESHKIEGDNNTSISHSSAISPEPNLEDLKKAEDKLQYLHQTYGKQHGWELGIILLRSKDSNHINEYINILAELDSNIDNRSEYIHKENFVHHIIQTNMDPSVIFNLMNHFTIPANLIKTTALKKGSKEKIMEHIESTYEGIEKLRIWQKCIAQNKSLGEFFHTKRHSWTSKTKSIIEIEQKIEILKKSIIASQTLYSTSALTEISVSPVAQVVYPALSAPQGIPVPVERNQFFQPQQSPVTPDVVVNKSTALPPLYVFATGAVVLVVLLSYLAQQSEDNGINQRPGF